MHGALIVSGRDIGAPELAANKNAVAENDPDVSAGVGSHLSGPRSIAVAEVASREALNSALGSSVRPLIQLAR